MESARASQDVKASTSEMQTVAILVRLWMRRSGIRTAYYAAKEIFLDDQRPIRLHDIHRCGPAGDLAQNITRLAILIGL